MSYFDSNYRFLLDDVVANVIVSNEFGIDFEKDEGSFYFRKKLSQDLKFYGAEYNTIKAAPVTTRFEVVLQRNESGAWVDYFPVYFYKNDCNFDDDIKTLEVKAQSDDAFEDIKKVLNNEYDVVKLRPEQTAFTYDLRPILQIVSMENTGIGPLTRAADTLTNFVGLTFWEEKLERRYAPDELIAFGFEGFTQAELAGQPDGVYFYKRYLTNLTTFDGVATTDRLEGDLSRTALFFTKTSKQTDEAEVFPGQTGNIPSVYGRSENCSDVNNNYFTDYGNLRPYNPPVNRTTPTWGSTLDPFLQGCQGYYLRVIADLNNFEIANSEEATVDNAYQLHDIIQKILEQETDIKFSNSTDYSEFFYSASDPVASKDINLFFTPKSNIVNAYYDNAARKSLMRLSELLKLLEAQFNVFWHVEIVGAEKRLRIEHISWYENGGTYGAQETSIDLTQSFDARTQLPLDYRQNKFKYSKAKMTERYEFAYDDDTQEQYNGFPIEVLTGEVPEGAIEKYDVKQFNPDISGITGREDVNLDGWAVLDCSFGTFWKVKKEDLIVPAVATLFGMEYVNGSLTFPYLHPLYHRYGKPATDLKINDLETTALSVARNKTQEVSFTAEGFDLDPLKLIKTTIGSGQPERISLNLTSNKYEIVINHDTE